MHNLAMFDWRTLLPGGHVQYKLDDMGRLLVRGTETAEPFALPGGRAIPAEWRHVDGDGWALRTKGNPSSVERMHLAHGDAFGSVSEALHVDDRILLVQAVCEAGWDRSANACACGKSHRSPRTEPGYPNRQSENDTGDGARDAEDYRISGGAHSSHGLHQCLIRTARGVCPQMFAHVPPEQHRQVLWDVNNSSQCIAALVRTLAADVQNDPLKVRTVFGAGGVYPANNRWGARYYDEWILLFWLAYWNDYAEVLGHPRDTLPSPPPPLPDHSCITRPETPSAISGLRPSLKVASYPEDAVCSPDQPDPEVA